MKLLIPLAIFAAAACSSVEDPRAFVVGYTHHAGAQEQVDWTDDGDPVYVSPYDEGLGIRGGGVAGTVGPVELSLSGYRQSIEGDGNGYTVAVTPSDTTLALGPLDLRPIGQINYYPDGSSDRLQETGGWFPSAGVSIRADVTDDVQAFCNLYPMRLGRLRGDDYNTDSLAVCGLSWALGGG